MGNRHDRRDGLCRKFRFAINWCSILVLIAGVVALCCYYYIDKRVLTNKNLFDPSQVKKKSKVKLSVKDSLKLIVSSPYLRLIAALVICYGVSINIVEVTWKKATMMCSLKMWSI